LSLFDLIRFPSITAVKLTGSKESYDPLILFIKQNVVLKHILYRT